MENTITILIDNAITQFIPFYCCKIIVIITVAIYVLLTSRTLASSLIRLRRPRACIYKAIIMRARHVCSIERSSRCSRTKDITRDCIAVHVYQDECGTLPTLQIVCT